MSSLTFQQEHFDFLSTNKLISLLYENKTRKRLKKFELSFCKITQANFTHLVEALCDNRSLNTINIHFNSFISDLLQAEAPPGITKYQLPVVADGEGKRRKGKKRKE